MYTTLAKVKERLSTPYPSDTVLTAEIKAVSKFIDAYTLRNPLYSANTSTREYIGDNCAILDVDNFIFKDSVVVLNNEPVNWKPELKIFDSFSQVILPRVITYEDTVKITAKFGILSVIDDTDVQEFATDLVVAQFSKSDSNVLKETIGRYSIEYGKTNSVESYDTISSVPLLDKYKRIIL